MFILIINVLTILRIIIMHIVIGEASNKCVHKSGLSTGNYIKQSLQPPTFLYFPFSFRIWTNIVSRLGWGDNGGD